MTIDPDEVFRRLGVTEVKTSQEYWQRMLNDPAQQLIPKSDPSQWQQELTDEINAIAAHSDQIAAEVRELVGRAENRICAIEVNSAGGLVSMKFLVPASVEELDVVNAAIAEALENAHLDAQRQLDVIIARFSTDSPETPEA